jgi:hypothetical protein
VNRLRVLIVGVLVPLVVAAAWARVGTTLVEQAPPRVTALNNRVEGQQRAGAKLFARLHRLPRTSNEADVHEASPGALFWVLRKER